MQEKELEVLLLLFLGRETGRDIRKRQISVTAAGIAALAAAGIRLLNTQTAGETVALGAQIAGETTSLNTQMAEEAVPLLSISAGMVMDLIPGVFLLLAAAVTRQAVGYGDGLVLLVCGLCIGFWETTALLILALLLLVPVSLGLLLSRRGNRKTELPFLPFLLAAWMIRLMLRA